jgi:hypothetical protein
MNVNGYEIEPDADLENADLEGADLSNANLRADTLKKLRHKPVPYPDGHDMRPTDTGTPRRKARSAALPQRGFQRSPLRRPLVELH